MMWPLMLARCERGPVGAPPPGGPGMAPPPGGQQLVKVAVPPGLKAFHGKLLEALTLQQTFFTKAVEASDDGQPWEAVIAIPEGKQASSLLINAWGVWQYWFHPKNSA